MKNSKPKKILFVPKWDEANPYQKLLTNSIKENNTEVLLDDYPVGFFPLYRLALKHSDIDIIHIHWISPMVMWLTWSKSPVIFRIKYFSLIADCLLVKVLGKKLVWTIHNKVAHEKNNLAKEISVRRLLSKLVDKIIIHSSEAKIVVEKLYNINISKKIEIIFHGNYNNCYPKPSKERTVLREDYKYFDTNKVIFFFGAVKPYKGVEKLVTVANNTDDESLNFLIAGEAIPHTYGDELIKMNQSSNLTFKFEYLDDQTLVDFIDIADVIVIPFSDTLTSGTVILAMTMGKGLVLPENAKVFGCVPDEGVIYFDNVEKLQSILTALTHQRLREMGEINFQAAKDMPWETVGKKTVDVYDKVL